MSMSVRMRAFADPDDVAWQLSRFLDHHDAPAVLECDASRRRPKVRPGQSRRVRVRALEDSAQCAGVCRLYSHDDVARRRLQKWTITAAEGLELPDRVNNLFAIILLLVMEWSLYLHIERHDWAGAAALRRHPRPHNCRNLPTSNVGCERKSQRRASSMRQTTASVHSVAVVTGWGRTPSDSPTPAMIAGAITWRLRHSK